MDNDNKFVKYGLIIGGALLLLAMFLPITYYQREASDRVRHVWFFIMLEIESGVVDWQITFQFTDPAYNALKIGTVLLFILAIAAPALLILSSFTRSKPKISKIFAILGLGLGIGSFVMMIMAASGVGVIYPPFMFDMTDLTQSLSMPHIGYIVGVAGLALSGIVIKSTDWEAL